MSTSIPLESPYVGRAIGGLMLLNEQAKRRVYRLHIKPASNRDFARTDKADLVLLVLNSVHVTDSMRPARPLICEGFWQ